MCLYARRRVEAARPRPPLVRPLVAAALGTLFTLACRALVPTPTATPPVLADCFWSAEALAWVDANGNGVQEADELPLAGVEINFNLTFLGGATTDAEGTAHLSGMHPGECNPTLANSVVAQAPPGYTPTTPLEVPYSESQALYAFGFKSSP